MERVLYVQSITETIYLHLKDSREGLDIFKVQLVKMVNACQNGSIACFEGFITVVGKL